MNSPAMSILAPCDVWRRGVLLCVGSVEDAEAACREHGVELDGERKAKLRENIDAAAVCMTVNDNADVLIWSQRPIPVPCLAHECVHAAAAILQKVGADGEEARAYLVEHLLDCLTSSVGVPFRSSPDAASRTTQKQTARSSRSGSPLRSFWKMPFCHHPLS